MLGVTGFGHDWLVHLALLSPIQRRAITVDLIARRLIHFRKKYGADWREWAIQEIAKLAEPYRHPVKDRLNELMAHDSAMRHCSEVAR